MRESNMKNNDKVKILAIILGIVLVSAALVCLFGLIENNLDKSDGNDPNISSLDMMGRIIYNGQQYKRNDRIKTVLLLGIDSLDEETEGDNRSQQSDFIAILIVNERDETYQILQINRDTMTQIRQLDQYGRVIGTYDGQLTLAHAYGSSENMRCKNSMEAVENLLYGIEIDHYLSITMDAVPILNDAIGGVTVTLRDDFTFMNPAYVKGTEVTLMGEEALTYVRARGMMEDPTNLNRMERQTTYMNAVLQKIDTLDLEDIIRAMTKLEDHLVSDCTIDQMSRLFDQAGDYEHIGTVSLPGEAVLGQTYMEYYVDELAVQKMVIDLFYRPVDTESSAD